LCWLMWHLLVNWLKFSSSSIYWVKLSEVKKTGWDQFHIHRKLLLGKRKAKKFTDKIMGTKMKG
jgi:hypothetical protein